ncbi:glycerophosphodiester phosphodiesterase family protein [Plebeiibacterium marinum]|uniref:Glycerophosphodiester phosphodiesterase family protein n=1 Tax=Plebeiibacterium marinum TaxID=2992111 RepID=A0AAE3SL32_9BACT|nr:glycerophosphodiester phosphodiesterase family protein [Plebeiobacterium marinum]MCW3807485.1 glycerophosphodiester phosphodiesterase family protein [Plebeiobacterium marinum]
MNILSQTIIAHRGESFDAPENSLSSIEQAWKRGANAVEIDVHLTADNEVLVIHDKHTGRVGDKKLYVKKSNLTELKCVDIGRKKSIKFIDERIPTLIEILKTVPSEAQIIIEIKCGKEIINPLIQILKTSTLRNSQIEIIAFNFGVITEIKKQAPHYKALWLLDLDYYLPHWLIRINLNKIINKVKKSNLDGVNVWAGKVIKHSFVKAFKKEGLLVYVWTVNDLYKAQNVINYGVDAITTDRAEWLTKQLVGTKQ